MMDMQFTLIRLIASAAFVIAGALFGSDDHIAFILYLLAYLLAAVPIAGNAIQELSHGRFLVNTRSCLWYRSARFCCITVLRPRLC